MFACLTPAPRLSCFIIILQAVNKAFFLFKTEVSTGRPIITFINEIISLHSSTGLLIITGGIGNDEELKSLLGTLHKVYMKQQHAVHANPKRSYLSDSAPEGNITYYNNLVFV